MTQAWGFRGGGGDLAFCRRGLEPFGQAQGTSPTALHIPAAGDTPPGVLPLPPPAASDPRIGLDLPRDSLQTSPHPHLRSRHTILTDTILRTV